MVNIAQVTTGGGGKFVKTTELRNYPFLVIDIHRIAYGVPGYKGQGTTTQVVGDFLALDSNHKVVFEAQGAKWDCGTNIGSKLPTQFPATVVISIRKEHSVKDGKDYNNLYNVGEPDITPIIALLEAREAEILAAMDDAPPF